MNIAIYARVSTRDKQEADNQLLQLRAYSDKQGFDIHREYVDYDSGGNPNRAQFKQLFLDASRKQFEIVLFWALDRFTREGAKETINYLSQLEAIGVGFISYTEPYLNTIGVFKDAIIAILATLAKQEKIRIKERVRAGLQKALKKGKKLGRKGLTPVEIRRVIEIYDQDIGQSVRTVARLSKVSPATAARLLSDYKAGLLDKEGFRYKVPLVSVE
ncbi:MAG: recombinase family protein [Dissulfurispiraceae bacterium]